MVKSPFGARTVSTFVQIMKRTIIILLLVFVVMTLSVDAVAQCSICSRTAAQLGEKPARGLNTGILYLAATPIITFGFIAFRWWRKNRRLESLAARH